MMNISKCLEGWTRTWKTISTAGSASKKRCKSEKYSEEALEPHMKERAQVQF